MSKPRRPPTIYDVAEKAGVSSATVSYVLSGRRGGRSRISSETRQRVVQAAKELGYAPNQSARNLRRRRTDRVCLALPILGAPYYDVLARDLQHAADENGYTLIIAIADSAQREQSLVHQLRRQLADGAVIIATHHISPKDISDLVDRGIAIVLYDPPFTVPGCDTIQTTDTAACKEAIEYLVAQGHRRIALLGQSYTSTNHSRVTCYQEILETLGIPVEPKLVQQDIDSRAEAYRAAQALLQSSRPPSAIVTSADILAIGVLWAARDLGVRVPDDLAVIGSGNIQEDEITYPPLTTIGPPSLDFGAVAELLFSRLQSQAPIEGRVHELSRTLILRESA